MNCQYIYIFSLIFSCIDILSNDNISKDNSSVEFDFVRDGSNENERAMALFNNKIEKLTEVEKSRCSKVLDFYTKLVIVLMKLAIKQANRLPTRAIDIQAPLNLPRQNLGIFRINMGKFIPKWDEDEPKDSSIRQLARWLVNNPMWDFTDCLCEFDTLEQGLAWRKKIFFNLPIPNIVYDDMLSDEAMSRLAFFGCACHYTQRVGQSWKPGIGIPDRKFLHDVVYVNDMTALSIFRVRKPFERYGAAAFFDKDFQIIAIYWSHASTLVRKGEQLWNHAKYVWRSSFFAYITICDHLIVTHMIESNAFVTASRKCLPVDHPLRLFIKPFTYHTVSINYQAAISLVNQRGLVHRIWAFDYDEFLKVCDYILINYKFKLLPQFISKSMTPEENQQTKEQWDQNYPIYQDATDFWLIIKNYVTRFFQINYSLLKNENNNHDNDDDDDKLPIDSHIQEFINELCVQLGIPGITSLRRFIDVLSQLIAASTGIHEHVGQISDYLIDPRFIGAKLEEGKEIQNIQTYTQILVLAVLTGLRMPGILEDWAHLIEHNQFYEQNLNNYRNFKQQLKELSKTIEDRNKLRKYPFQSFNPKYIECSTSV